MAPPASRRRARPAVVRVAALLVGLVALVLVRELARGLPWWAAGACAVIAFAVAARAVNATADELALRRAARARR